MLNAIAFENLELVRFLVERGADPNVEVDDGYTCLLTAIESDATESTLIVAELIRAGADPTMRETVQNRTPLEIASYVAKGPDPNVVEYLKRENIRIDIDRLFGDMDLPAEELDSMKRQFGATDMSQIYFNNSKELVKTGNHVEVIRILKEFC